MNRLRILVVVVLVLNVVLQILIAVDRHKLHLLRRKSATECAIIHEPASGCPPDYRKEIKPRFTEADGSKQYACVSPDPAKGECVDAINPGERVEMIFHVEMPSEPRPTT
jgi:hypothetical protein